MNLLFAGIFAAVCLTIFVTIRRIVAGVLGRRVDKAYPPGTFSVFMPLVGALHLFAALVVMAEGSWEAVKILFFPAPEVWFYSTIAFQAIVGLWLALFALGFSFVTYIKNITKELNETEKK